MKLVLLGTKGGPRLSLLRSSPAQAVLAGGRVILVDCGEGAPYQLLRAGIRLESLTDLFITHHHSDHNGSYGNVLLMSWSSGLGHPIDCYGPPPLSKMTGAFFEMNAYDLATRVLDEGRPPLAGLVDVHEFDSDGVVVDNGDLRVTARVVVHPPVEPSLAYRFDAEGRSLVISGDTAPCDALVELARGADVLVHEVMHPGLLEAGIRRTLANIGWEEMRAHLLNSHTSLEDVGKVAAAAGVGKLVLSHFVPAEPVIPDDEWAAPARRIFGGEVIIGRDLMEIEL